MNDRTKSHRVRITSETKVTVSVGAASIDFSPGWSGPVVPDAYHQLMKKGAAVDLNGASAADEAPVGHDVPETGEVDLPDGYGLEGDGETVADEILDRLDQIDAKIDGAQDADDEPDGVSELGGI